VSQNVFIGTSPTDGEATNPTTGSADYDDTHGAGPDDEDLVLPTDLYAGVAHTFTIPVTRLPSVTSARLGVWVDWNGDGDVNDANEVVTVNTPVNTGVVTVTLNPPDGSDGIRYMRVRIQAGTSDVSFSGTSTQQGEVEDYALNVLPCPVLNVTGPTGFPKGAIGVPYPSQSFTASGAAGPYA
jgi:hypothetical protein